MANKLSNLLASLVVFASSLIASSLVAEEELTNHTITAETVAEQSTHAQRNVLLVTLDGLRWQEVFSGADERLVDDGGGVKDVAATSERFLRPTAQARREALMPFLWSEIARQGVMFGNPADNCSAKVTNEQHFSYPGYSEILCGFADPRIDSNAKEYNNNVTVLEWLHRRPEFAGRVAAICSWDVFPFIINDRRSGIPVNAGWHSIANLVDENHNGELRQLDALADQIPRLWPNVRYDYFTFRAAQSVLQHNRPRVLYVSLGETDDWAHEGRYDLYLDAARRNDEYLRELWQTIQNSPQYRDSTTLIVTTDHGRGDGREQWKSHSKTIPGCNAIWVAMLGPGIQHQKQSDKQVTQSQIAATVAACVGYDLLKDQPQAAPPLTQSIPAKVVVP